MLINVLRINNLDRNNNSWSAVEVDGNNFRSVIRDAIRKGLIEVEAGDIVTVRDPAVDQGRIYFMQVDEIEKIEPVAAKTVVKLVSDKPVEVAA